MFGRVDGGVWRCRGERGGGAGGAGGGGHHRGGRPRGRAGWSLRPHVCGPCFPPGHLSPQWGPVVGPDRLSSSPSLWTGLSSGSLDAHRDAALGTSPQRRLPHRSQTAPWFCATHPPTEEDASARGPGLSPEPVLGVGGKHRPSAGGGPGGRVSRRGRGLSEPGAAVLTATGLAGRCSKGLWAQRDVLVHRHTCGGRALVCS